MHYLHTCIEKGWEANIHNILASLRRKMELGKWRKGTFTLFVPFHLTMKKSITYLILKVSEGSLDSECDIHGVSFSLQKEKRYLKMSCHV